MLSDLTWKKIFAPGMSVTSPPAPRHPPFSTALYIPIDVCKIKYKVKGT